MDNQTDLKMIHEMQQYEKDEDFMEAYRRAGIISDFYRSKGLFEKAIRFNIKASDYLDMQFQKWEIRHKHSLTFAF